MIAAEPESNIDQGIQTVPSRTQQEEDDPFSAGNYDPRIAIPKGPGQKQKQGAQNVSDDSIPGQGPQKDTLEPQKSSADSPKQPPKQTFDPDLDESMPSDQGV